MTVPVAAEVFPLYAFKDWHVVVCSTYVAAYPFLAACFFFIQSGPIHKTRCPKNGARVRMTFWVRYLFLLGGSWDLVSKVISTLIGVIIKYNYSYLFITLITKSHDPLSSGLLWSDLSGSPHKLHPLSPEMGLG